MNGQELIERFVAKSGVDKERADRFYKEFFQVLTEGLEKEGYVRVKGLGSFKLLVIEPRESINISTGERFEIQGHNRITFTPEPGLKELVNKPFAHLETVIIEAGSPLASAGEVEETAEETPVETKPQTQEEAVAEAIPQAVAEDVAVEAKPQTAETAAVKVIPQAVAEEAVVETKPQPVEAVPVEPVQETVAAEAEPMKSTESEDKQPKPTVASTPAPAPVERKQVKDETPMWIKVAGWIMAVIFVLCVIALLLLYVPGLRKLVFEKRLKQAMQTELQMEATTAVEKLPGAETNREVSASASTTVNEKAGTATSATSSDKSLAAASTSAKPAVESGTTASQPATALAVLSDSVEYEIVGTLAEYTIGEGETLARVALKYYGTRALWPYIVKYNQATIPNPDRVTSGLTVRVPRLEKRGK